jgi:hypothetical protein
MSATKIAASFRVSLTALAPKAADLLVAVALAWPTSMLRWKKEWKQGARPHVLAREIYPRRG